MTVVTAGLVFNIVSSDSSLADVSPVPSPLTSVSKIGADLKSIPAPFSKYRSRLDVQSVNPTYEKITRGRYI